MVTGLGNVDLVKVVSLKHNMPSSLIVVFERYSENPKRFFINRLSISKMEQKGNVINRDTQERF